MILLADSGSTKTQWSLINKTQEIKTIFTKGINPFYQAEDEISEELALHLMPELTNGSISTIYFYGAGCSFPDKKEMVRKAFERHFNDATIEIESDLLGAARALFQRNKGIACILGTGSNSCFYDGTTILENVSPLGFILGDEGSGAVLGKYLVGDCLKNQLPNALKEKFLTKYSLTPASILENVYKKPFPNRYLAQFTPFLLENIAEPAIFNLVFDCFDAFLVRNVMQYELEGVQIGCIGSIAHYFRDTLEIVANERAIVISEIAQSPMNGLVKFHTI
jgi:N-acetylglucosamine kinase-like BadF-type ATPase